MLIFIGSENRKLIFLYIYKLPIFILFFSPSYKIFFRKFSNMPWKDTQRHSSFCFLMEFIAIEVISWMKQLWLIVPGHNFQNIVSYLTNKRCRQHAALHSKCKKKYAKIDLKQVQYITDLIILLVLWSDRFWLYYELLWDGVSITLFSLVL